MCHHKCQCMRLLDGVGIHLEDCGTNAAHIPCIVCNVGDLIASQLELLRCSIIPIESSTDITTFLSFSFCKKIIFFGDNTTTKLYDEKITKC